MDEHAKLVQARHNTLMMLQVLSSEDVGDVKCTGSELLNLKLYRDIG